MDCSHCFVEDFIDIDLDTSKQIFYCEKCFLSICHKGYIDWIQSNAYAVGSAVGANYAGDPPTVEEAPELFPPRV